jgi:hypothetical protein
MVKWTISSTRWPDGDEHDGAKLRTVRQWLEDRGADVLGGPRRCTRSERRAA